MSDVAEIEQEHQKLIDMLNALNEALNKHEPRQDIYRVIGDIIAYTELHFANEEHIMAQSGFPEIELHKNHHQRMISEAHRLKEKYDEVGEELFSEWYNHWFYKNFLAHIQYADKPIEDYILQNGVKQ
ncbi:MAG: hemerythrin family protein [Gallionella sp.]